MFFDVTNAGLIRVKFTMTDCLRETIKSFARSFAGRPTSFNPPPVIGLIGGGKPSFKGVTAMSQNTRTKCIKDLIMSPLDKIKRAGFSLWLESVDGLEDGLCIELSDKLTGRSTDILKSQQTIVNELLITTVYTPPTGKH
jgi:hypothetical protein